MTARLVRVGDIAEQLRGVSYSKGDASEEPRDGYVAVLRAGNISEHGLVLDDLVYVPKARVSAKQMLRKHDILIAASSGSLDVVGKAAAVPENLDAGFGAFCKVVRPGSGVWPAYLGHFFRTSSYRRRVSAAAAGININNLRNEDLDELELPLPDLAEQRRIAAILDQADALRAKRRAAIAELASIEQALFLDMFGDPAANSMGWPVCDLGTVGDVQGGLQVTRARDRNPIEVPYLRVANVLRGRLELQEVKTIRATQTEVLRTSLATGDLLVVEGHGNPQEIGRVAVWDGSVNPCVHQNHIIRVRLDPIKATPIYASEVLNSPGGRRHLLRAGKTTSGLNTISVSDVRTTPLMLPPVGLQERFAARVESVRAVQRSQLSALGGLEELFASLQHRAFMGSPRLY